MGAKLGLSLTTREENTMMVSLKRVTRICKPKKKVTGG
jgi:hypothetical protein